MPIFPTSPTLNQEFTNGGTTWVWNGTVWKFKRGSSVAALTATVRNSPYPLSPREIGVIRVPYAATISSVTLLSDVSGSAVVDIQEDDYVNYPPTSADSICASAKPTLSSASKYTDTTLTGWSTSVPAGSVLRLYLESASTITSLTVVINLQRS